MEQLEQQFKTKGLVRSLGNYQVNINNQAIAANKLDITAVKKAAIDFMKKMPGILYVIDMADAQNATIPPAYRDQIMNGYNVERSGALQIIMKPGWYSGSKTGTTHGTISPYDTHIPLVFMGWGVKQGKSNVSHNMTDIAATISALLRIQEPNGNIGKPITEALK